MMELFVAIKNKDLYWIKELLQDDSIRSKINEYSLQDRASNFDVLSYAIKCNSGLSIVKFLYENGAKIDKIFSYKDKNNVVFNITPVMFAVEYHVEIGFNDSYGIGLNRMVIIFLLEKLLEENPDLKLSQYRGPYQQSVIERCHDFELLRMMAKKFPQLADNIFYIPPYLFCGTKQDFDGISASARFSPKHAVSGCAWQSSIAFESQMRKKTIVVDKSFLSLEEKDIDQYQSRKIKQLVRMLKEGFDIYLCQNGDKFVKITIGFGLDRLRACGSFNENKHFKILAEEFSLSKDEIAVFNSSIASRTANLFCFPFLYDYPRPNFVFDQDSAYKRCSKIFEFDVLHGLGYFDQIDLLPQENLLYLIRSKACGVAEQLKYDDDKLVEKYLEIALYFGNLEVVREIEKQKRDIVQSKLRSNFVWIVMEGGDAKGVEFILDNGFDLTLMDNGNTALMFAARYNTAEVVRILIEKGANLDLQNKDGLTALMFAARYNTAEVVRILIEKGANLDLQNKDGLTALMFAARYNTAEVVRILIKKGAKLDLQNKDGDSALIIALVVNEEIADILIKEGSRTNLVNKSGDNYHNIISVFAPQLIGMSTNNKRANAIDSFSKKNLLRIASMAPSSGINYEDHSLSDRVMLRAGEVINQSTDARYRIKTDVCNIVNKKIAVCKSKQKYEIGVKTISDEDIAELKTKSDAGYVLFSCRSAANKTTKLFLVNYPSKLHGIKLPDGVRIVESFQDEFGFYHIKTNRTCIFEYVLRCDVEKTQISNENPVVKVFKQYKKNCNHQTKALPKKADFENHESFLQAVFESGEGSCGLKVEAFFYYLGKHKKGKFGEDYRAVLIDNNHIALEICDQNNIWRYLDLGGFESRSSDLQDRYYYDLGAILNSVRMAQEVIRVVGILWCLMGVGTGYPQGLQDRQEVAEIIFLLKMYR